MNNGYINDKYDSWYNHPKEYNLFSEAEDKGKKSLKAINKILNDLNHQVINPVDLGTGTGKVCNYIINNIKYEGTVTALDNNKNMIDYCKNRFQNNGVNYILNNIEDFKLDNKSTLIIASFSYPSKIIDYNKTKKELYNIFENLLDDDSLFISIGWDYNSKDQSSIFFERYVNSYSKENSKNNLLNDKCIYNLKIKTSLLYENYQSAINNIQSIFGDLAKTYIEKNKLVKLNLNLNMSIINKKNIYNIIKKMEKLP